MEKKSLAPKIGLAFAAGVTAGWLASLFIPETNKKKLKRNIVDKTEDLKKALTDPKEIERIKDVFKETNQKTTRFYQDIKGTLAQSVATLKTVNRQKYLNAIDETINTFKEDKKLSPNELNKLKRYLAADYNKIKTVFKPATPTKSITRDKDK